MEEGAVSLGLPSGVSAYWALSSSGRAKSSGLLGGKREATGKGESLPALPQRRNAGGLECGGGFGKH